MYFPCCSCNMYEGFLYTAFALLLCLCRTALRLAHDSSSGLGRAEPMINSGEGRSQSPTTCSSVHMPRRRALPPLAAGETRFVWVPGEARLAPAPGPPRWQRAPWLLRWGSLSGGIGHPLRGLVRGREVRGAWLPLPGVEQPCSFPRDGRCRGCHLLPCPALPCAGWATAGHQPQTAARRCPPRAASAPSRVRGAGPDRTAPPRSAPRCPGIGAAALPGARRGLGRVLIYLFVSLLVLLSFATPPGLNLSRCK